MTEVRERPLDAAVAPRRFFLGYAHNELLHLLGNTAPATLTTLRTPVKLLGDQSFVAMQEGVGRGDYGDLLEALATERMGQCGEGRRSVSVRHSRRPSRRPLRPGFPRGSGR